MRTLNMRVAGVTFENRQSILACLEGGELCQLRPEPESAFDRNAIAIYVTLGEGIPARHMGYVPRDLAAEIAPFLEGEAVIGRVSEITGGFAKFGGGMASLGARVVVEIPDDV